MPPSRLGTAVLVALAGCGRAPTQLVVVIQTDMAVPEELTGFSTRVGPAGAGQPTDVRTFGLDERAGSVSLPATFGVVPRDGDADRRVRIEVEALRGDTVLFTTHAVTGFVEERRLRLDLFLAGQCVALAPNCGGDETCTADGCVDEEVNPRDLDPFEGLDAGGLAPPDAGGPAPPDAARPEPDAALPPDDSGVDAGGQPPGEWAMVAGAGTRSAVVAAAADREGNVFLAVAVSSGVFVVDGDPLAADGRAFTLVAIAQDGSFLWHPTLLDSEEPAWVQPLALQVDDAGHLWLVGYLGGAAELGRGPEQDVLRAAFVARYDAATGDLQDAILLPGLAATAMDIVVTDEGVAIAGSFQGTLTLPDASVLTGQGDQAFVVRMTAEGQLDCAYAAEATASRAQSIAHDESTGALLVGGVFSGDYTVGVDVLTAVSPQDGFLLTSNDCLPERPIPLPQHLEGVSVWLIEPDTALAAATINPFLGDADLYVALVSAGGVVSEGFHGSELTRDSVLDLVPVSDGAAAAMAGTFGGALDLGAALLEPAGAVDSFVAGVAPDGIITWAEAIAGPGNERIGALAAVPGSDVLYLAGSFEDRLSLAGVELTTEEALGIFLYRKVVPN